MKRKFRPGLTFVAMLTGWASVAAHADTVEDLAGRFVVDSRHVGLSIGVYDRGKTMSWHYGSTHRDRASPPTDRTLYEIASLTKTFTGILLAQAVVP